jgi:hypothetical protein
MFEGYTLFLLLSLPALALGIWAQFKVRSAFNKNAEVRTSTGMTGAQVAKRVLDTNGLTEVHVERADGFLSDHYDPRHRVLRLSPDVYDGNSLSAAGVAAHEAGHALQHKEGYAMLKLRSAMVPAVQIGSWAGPLIFIAGFFMAGMIGTSLAWLGFLLFAAVALFALVTLPVEFDASNRAKRLLVSQNIVFPQEMGGVNAVLNAAALTYVAAAIQAISTLMYYGMMLIGINRD